MVFHNRQDLLSSCSIVFDVVIWDLIEFNLIWRFGCARFTGSFATQIHYFFLLLNSYYHRLGLLYFGTFILFCLFFILIGIHDLLLLHVCLCNFPNLRLGDHYFLRMITKITIFVVNGCASRIAFNFFLFLNSIALFNLIRTAIARRWHLIVKLHEIFIFNDLLSNRIELYRVSCDGDEVFRRLRFVILQVGWRLITCPLFGFIIRIATLKFNQTE